MANIYDPPAMGTGADNIERELEVYKEALRNIRQTMAVIRPEAFDDQTGQRFVELYHREAEPCMEQTAATIAQFVLLLRTCSKKFGNAIDNGNAYLTT